ncbi:MASE1 domain-containing protein [Mangrovivirga sp. M17]|uniref:histidine kinase n=1 Tax=Mangrovivirga halotolerans TaxID=2993936 RepID=A0ABT3RWC0_9BACT|nr:MASE1 domain-containing protein [Mangrovivirga halotolerans]MCX2746078.1 MASE1 domain-containing protein [Mangrovivirga halotolerans]
MLINNLKAYIFFKNANFQIVFLSLIYILAALMGIKTMMPDINITPVWPATGIIFAFVLLMGYQSWPGVFIGSLISNFLLFNFFGYTFDYDSILAAVFISIGHTVEVLVGFILVKFYIKTDKIFVKTIDTFKFLGVSMFMSTIGAFITVGAYQYFELISYEDYVFKFVTLWIGSMVSLLLFTPFILSWNTKTSWVLTKNHFFEFIAFLLSISILWILWQIDFLSMPIEKSFPLLSIPFLLWLAFRFNLQASMTGILVLAQGTVFYTVDDLGPFVANNHQNSLLLLQIYIAVVSAMTIIISATVTERNEAQQKLIGFNENLEVKIQERTKELKEEISNRKKTEKELLTSNRDLIKANEELDNFVYSVSHDLRAPIASVLGLVNLAQLETDIKRVKTILEKIAKSAEQQDAFIKDILDLSRNARLEVENEIIDLSGMALDICQQLKYSGHNKPVEPEINIEKSSDFASDAKRLRVILNNLLSNAIRYSDDEKPEVIVDVKITKASVRIKISDNGIGIEKDHMPRIFDMFYRATDKNSGSGLGLYIVKETLNKLNGQVFLDSTPDKGTDVEIILPNNRNNLPPSNSKKKSAKAKIDQSSVAKKTDTTQKIEKA